MPVGGYGIGPQQTLTVQDADGSPLVTGVIKMKFTNGSVTDDGGGVVSINTSAGDITGSGTANTIPKFTSASVVGDSLLTDNGTTLAYNTNKLTITASNGNTAIAGTLGVTSDFAVATNKFTVAAASGNTFFAGVLSGGSGPTTITDSTGKILSAALNTVGAAQGGTGIANNAASTITISGNFATTFTVSGTTGVTLPTTGTLLTTTGSGAGLSGVTLSAVVPNTAPSAGQILAGNAGGTAYAPVSMSGDATLASTGAITLASTISAGGPIGSATATPIITYDAKGRLTTVSSATITPAVGSITGFGTGVATALAINIGSAGAPVLFNGAGGTPSSMTGTNITGTASGLTAGTASAVAVGGITGLGTGVGTALAVNVGSAGAFVTFNGAGGTPSSLVGTNITGTATGLTAGTASAVAVGGITGLGTGVGTALAINVGTAGAFVVNGGALGTPSSGTVTNLTGTASININGTVGATTPTTGVFTTVTTAVSSTTQAESLIVTNTSNASNTTKAAVIDFQTKDTAVTLKTIAQIVAHPDTNVNSNDGAIEFYTRTGDIAPVSRMKIDSTGVVYMTGLASSSAATTGTVCWTTGTGMLNVDTTTTCLLSSAKYKKNSRALDLGLDAVLRLKPVSYLLKKKYDPGIGRQVGFFAEDVAEVDKRLVSLETDGSPHAVRYQQLTAVLVNAIQEQHARYELLASRFNTLWNMVNA